MRASAPAISSASWYRAHRRRHARAAPPQRRPHGRHAEDPPAGRSAPPCSPPVEERSHRTDRRRSSGESRGPTTTRSTCCSPTGPGGRSLSPVVVHRPSDLGDLSPVRRQRHPHDQRAAHALRPRCRRCPVGERRGRPRGDDRAGVTGGAASGAGTPRPTVAAPASSPCATRSTTGSSTASRWTACSSRRCIGSCVVTGCRRRVPRRGRGYEVDFWIVDTPSCSSATVGQPRPQRSASSVTGARRRARRVGIRRVRFPYRQIMRRPAPRRAHPPGRPPMVPTFSDAVHVDRDGTAQIGAGSVASVVVGDQGVGLLGGGGEGRRRRRRRRRSPPRRWR